MIDIATPLKSNIGKIFVDRTCIGIDDDDNEMIVETKHHAFTPEHIRWSSHEYNVKKAKKELGL